MENEHVVFAKRVAKFMDDQENGWIDYFGLRDSEKDAAEAREITEMAERLNVGSVNHE
jgi:hypothetical protein